MEKRYMTDFENDMLLKLLSMKEQELKALAEDKELKIRKEVVNQVSRDCSRLFNMISTVDEFKYKGF